MECGHLGAGVRAIAVPGRSHVENVLGQYDGPTESKSNPEAQVTNAEMAKPSDGHERAGCDNHQRDNYDFYHEGDTVRG